MNNKFKGNDKANVRLKNLFNYHPKIYLVSLGSKNNTFFFGNKFSYQSNSCVRTPLSQIVVQKQFSLNGQAKILKKWCVDFKNFAFMNKSNEFIALCDQEVQKWEFDCSYNLGIIFQTLFKYPLECFNSQNEDFLKDPDQLQLSIMDDWITVSKNNHIFFIEKEIDGNWKCIEKMILQFNVFLLNEQGNVMIIQQEKDNYEIYYYFVVYIKDNLNKWTIITKLEADFKDNIYFLDNEQFAVVHKTSDLTTIWEVQPLKLEITLLQNLKLGLKSYEVINFMIVIKQSKLLIFQTFTNLYFLIKNNQQFSIKETIKIIKLSKVENEDGFLINIVTISDKKSGRNFQGKIEIQKIFQN